MLDIGVQLIKALEILHESGNTHNDLKLENLMLSDLKTGQEANNVVLIDYGFASKYIEISGEHKK